MNVSDVIQARQHLNLENVRSMQNCYLVSVEINIIDGVAERIQRYLLWFLCNWYIDSLNRSEQINGQLSDLSNCLLRTSHFHDRSRAGRGVYTSMSDSIIAVKFEFFCWNFHETRERWIDDSFYGNISTIEWKEPKSPVFHLFAFSSAMTLTTLSLSSKFRWQCRYDGFLFVSVAFSDNFMVSFLYIFLIFLCLHYQLKLINKISIHFSGSWQRNTWSHSWSTATMPREGMERSITACDKIETMLRTFVGIGANSSETFRATSWWSFESYTAFRNTTGVGETVGRDTGICIKIWRI